MLHQPQWTLLKLEWGKKIKRKSNLVLFGVVPKEARGRPRGPENYCEISLSLPILSGKYLFICHLSSTDVPIYSSSWVLCNVHRIFLFEIIVFLISLIIAQNKWFSSFFFWHFISLPKWTKRCDYFYCNIFGKTSCAKKKCFRISWSRNLND